MLKAEGFTKLKCTLPHQISRSDKGKEVINVCGHFPNHDKHVYQISFKSEEVQCKNGITTG